MNKDIECPYCEQWLEICHDDGFGYEEETFHEYECHYCEKNFVFITSISFSYEGYKADCLNGSKHNWKPTMTYPKYFTQMVCSMCDEKRVPTDEEKDLYNIPKTYPLK